ncbi:MAG: type-F conjugative transfer system secretin TraK [Candidatus Tectomicrobia bacterium]|nr:type-F conjugative transfer system secretin TraK [Candidatus Tectomicrobia bacterium]
MRFFFICMTTLGFVSSVHAARLEISDGEPVDIHISVDSPTVVTFPEKIRAIPTSADPQALSLEIEGERLFIQSLREGFGAVLFVVGHSGRLHLLSLVEHEPADTEVQLIPPPPPRFDDAPPAATGRPGRTRKPQGNPLRRLMVTMLRGDTLPGVEVLAHEQPLTASRDIEIRTTHLYAAGRYLGFVGTARNLTAEPYVLRLPEYQAPGLKAIAADLEAIPAGGETRVYLVVEPGSPY